VNSVKGALLTLVTLLGLLTLWIFASLATAYPEGSANVYLIIIVGIAAIGAASFPILKIPERQ
jgi:hypothetical protein